MNLKTLLSNRAIAIFLVAVISGTSFALGFFVGKTVKKDVPHISPFLEEGTVSPAEEGSQRGESPLPKGTVSPAGKGTASPQTPSYSVQIGAFKKRQDAETLKKALEGKGYKIYLSSAPEKGTVSPQAGAVYKVRAGRFSSKKEAEIFALKLKKSEGLEAFVTSE